MAGHEFIRAAFEAAWESLTKWRATLRSPAKKKHADRLLNDVSDRRWDTPTAESTAALPPLQDSGQWHLDWPIPGLAKISGCQGSWADPVPRHCAWVDNLAVDEGQMPAEGLSTRDFTLVLTL